MAQLTILCASFNTRHNKIQKKKKRQVNNQWVVYQNSVFFRKKELLVTGNHSPRNYASWKKRELLKKKAVVKQGDLKIETSVISMTWLNAKESKPLSTAIRTQSACARSKLLSSFPRQVIGSKSMTPLKCSGYMCFPSGNRRAERSTYPDHTEGTDAHKRIFHLAEETHNDQKSGKATAPVRK